MDGIKNNQFCFDLQRSWFLYPVKRTLMFCVVKHLCLEPHSISTYLLLPDIFLSPSTVKCFVLFAWPFFQWYGQGTGLYWPHPIPNNWKVRQFQTYGAFINDWSSYNASELYSLRSCDLSFVCSVVVWWLVCRPHSVRLLIKTFIKKKSKFVQLDAFVNLAINPM